MELGGGALQVVGPDAAVQLSRAIPEFFEGTRGLVLQQATEFRSAIFNIARFFDPGGSESVHSEQMMRHPERGIFEGIRMKWNRLATAREIIEGTGVHGFTNFAIRDGLPLVRHSLQFDMARVTPSHPRRNRFGDGAYLPATAPSGLEPSKVSFNVVPARWRSWSSVLDPSPYPTVVRMNFWAAF